MSPPTAATKISQQSPAFGLDRYRSRNELNDNKQQKRERALSRGACAVPGDCSFIRQRYKAGGMEWETVEVISKARKHGNAKTAKGEGFQADQFETNTNALSNVTRG